MTVEEVQEITTPIRTIAQANAAHDELIRKHAPGLRRMASEDVQQAGTTYQLAIEALDERLQSILFDEHGRARLPQDEAAQQRALFDQQRQQPLAAFRKELATLTEAADEAIEWSAQNLVGLSRPALDTLTAPELERAAHRREFIKEDCEELGLRDLVARIDQVLSGKDRADLALYQRYAQKRLDAVFVDPSYAPRSEVVQLLQQALVKLDQHLIDPAVLAKREKYQAQQRAGELLKQAISAARFGFDPEAITQRAQRWGMR